MPETQRDARLADTDAGAKAGAKPGGALMRLAPAFIIAIALAAFFASGAHRFFTIDVLRENRQVALQWVEANPLLALAAFIALYAGVVAISFPGASVLTITGGFLFGVWPGVPAIVVAATIGAFVIYLAARSIFAGGLRARAGSFVERLEAGLRGNEFSYMLLLRLVPLFPFWAVNIAAGVAGVKPWNYVAATFLGIIPASFVYAGVGATIGEAFDAGREVTLKGVLLQPQSLAILGVFVALAVAPIFYRAATNKGSVKAANR